jgi:hypothetical protein
VNKITGAYDLTDITEKQLSTLCDTLSEFSVNSYNMEISLLNSTNIFGEGTVNLLTSISDKLDELSMNSYALGTSILDSYNTGNENLMNLINSDFGLLFSIVQDTTEEEKLLVSVNEIKESISKSHEIFEGIGTKLDILDNSLKFSAMTIEALMVAFNPIEALGNLINEVSNGFENINSHLQTLVILNVLAEKLLENISSQVTIQATLTGTASGDSGTSDFVVDAGSSIGTGLFMEGAATLLGTETLSGGVATLVGIETFSGGAATPLVLLGGLVLGATALYNYAMDDVKSNDQKVAYEDAVASSNIFNDTTEEDLKQLINPYLNNPTLKTAIYNSMLMDLIGSTYYDGGNSSENATISNDYDQNVAGFNEDDLPVGYSGNTNEIQMNSDELKHLTSSCSEKIKIINNSLTPTININMGLQEVFDKNKLIQEINNALKEEIKLAPEGEYEG